MMTETQLLELCQKYADKAGYRLNPDKHIVDTVIKSLLANEEKHGFRYCPCRVVSGDKLKDQAIICPCKYHKAEIAQQGHCHCMLFCAKE